MAQGVAIVLVAAVVVSCSKASVPAPPVGGILIQVDDCARTILHDDPEITRSSTEPLALGSLAQVEIMPWTHGYAAPMVDGVVHLGPDTLKANALFEQRLGTMEPPIWSEATLGTYWLRLEAPGYQTAVGRIEVRTVGTTSVTIPLVERPIC